jgi:hypothetical protein
MGKEKEIENIDDYLDLLDKLEDVDEGIEDNEECHGL